MLVATHNSVLIVEYFNWSILFAVFNFILILYFAILIAISCFQTHYTPLTINQSLYFIKQQRVIKKVTTHRGVPWRFVTLWFKSQKDLIKSWINPWGERCYIDSIDGQKAVYFFSLVSVNMFKKSNSFSMRNTVGFSWWGKNNMQWHLSGVATPSFKIAHFILPVALFVLVVLS